VTSIEGLSSRSGPAGGGGRKTTVSQDASLLRDLESLVEPSTRGDPESPLRWTCKSLRKLAEERKRMGHGHIAGSDGRRRGLSG
jgi:hypothetical protein